VKLELHDTQENVLLFDEGDRVLNQTDIKWIVEKKSGRSKLK